MGLKYRAGADRVSVRDRGDGRVGGLRNSRTVRILYAFNDRRLMSPLSVRGLGSLQHRNHRDAFVAAVHAYRPGMCNSPDFTLSE